MNDNVQNPYSTRVQILKTAKYLFDLKGFEKTSFTDISDKLQMNEQDILFFFQSIDDLLEAVWSES